MSNNPTDINRKATDSDSAETPPQLSKIGLRRAHKMSKTNESQRLLRSQTADKEDDELFVKLPKFSKRLRGKTPAEVQDPVMEIDVSVKEPLPTNQKLYKYLKQPYCQRWIWCEFLESFIDRAILASAYDMDSYIVSFYPQLQTRQLPRRSWQMIRRNMGKARRFSTAFITGERIELERVRRIVRQLQQRKFDMKQDRLSLELMPKQIPVPLSVDAKVISLLGAPQLMLCKGRIVGYEPKDSSYLVKFNIAGKHTVLSMIDCLLHVLQECKTVPLASIVQEADEKQLGTLAMSGDGDEPKALMEALLQLHKLVALKRKTVQDMAAMNEELEASGLPAPARRETKQTPLREKLQRRYAANMITLHRVNSDLLEPLRVAHHYLNEYEKDTLQSKCIPRNKLYEKCRTLAEMDLKASPGQSQVQVESTRELILRLQTLLYLCGELGHGNNIEVDAVMDDFVSNMMMGLPSQLAGEFGLVVALLQPLRDRILTMTQTESERCQQLIQMQQCDSASLVLNEESDIEMGL